jgi:hypothetical protein
MAACTSLGPSTRPAPACTVDPHIDLQVRLEQPLIRLSQQEGGLDDLGVAGPQPFIAR